MDMSQIWAEFENNGVTKDLDDLDYLMIKSRRRKATPVQTVNDQMLKSIEKVRQILVNMKPLSGRKFCVFCKNNKEQPSVYSTHVVKNEKGEVTCPILSKYVCPMCHATGKVAHTIKYCPYNQEGSSVDGVFKTTRNGAGKERQNLCSRF